MEIELVTKKWGSSLGIVLPKTIVEKEQILENEIIIVEIKRINQIIFLENFRKFYLLNLSFYQF